MRTVPDLVRKEILAALAGLCTVFLLSVVLNAPLAGPADPAGIPPEHVKAPWIFVGIQQMLRYLPPFVAGVLLPLCALIVVAFLPFVPVGRLPARTVFFGIVVVCLILTVWGYVA
jgi:quinol-cytochrome oxidoreductase complex cytochrome b subunit